MQAMTKIVAISVLLALWFVTSAGAQPAASQNADDKILQLYDDVIRTMTEYRGKLASVLEIEQKELARLAKEVEAREPLFKEGLISRKDFEEDKLALARASSRITETEREIREAENLITEAEARATMASQQRIDEAGKGGAPNGYSDGGMMVRYDGKAQWSLADFGRIENFFYRRFGHSLPVSAWSETDLHRRMHLDHRNAMDVALNPDSIEGQALTDYLRGAGIPYLAFRGRVAGASTGAHIHIGKPSLRLAAP